MTSWRRILIAALSVLPFWASAETIVLHEDFDSNWSTLTPPANWRIAYTVPAGATDWHRAPDLGHNPWSDNPTPYALMFRDTTRVTYDSLISPEMDCSNLARVVLRCSTGFVAGAGALFWAGIVGSTDGGATWPNLVRRYMPYTNQPPAPETLALDWAAGAARVRLAWLFHGNSGDLEYWALDNVTVKADSQSRDVGVSRILTPLGVADSGAVIFPAALVRNYGDAMVDFSAMCRIGADYQSEIMVFGLAPGNTRTVRFDAWIAGAQGVQAVMCSTELAGDANSTNDVRHDSVRVQVFPIDAAATEVLWPRDTVDYGVLVTPVVTVQNLSSSAASFPVRLRIGNYYADTETVVNLDPYATYDLVFQSWVPLGAGSTSLSCSTALESDGNPQNDTLRRAVFVRSTDARLDAILAPAGAVPESAVVTPRVLVTNSGNTGRSIPVGLQISRSGDTVYSDSQTVTLSAGGRETLSFAPWTAAPKGSYVVSAQTRLSGDLIPGNDSAAVRFTAGSVIHDVGVAAVLRPRGSIFVGSVQPSARVHNWGETWESFQTFFAARGLYGQVYADSLAVVDLAAGVDTTLYFRTWNADSGRYAVICSTALEVDTNRANDFLVDSIVVAVPTLGWLELDTLPSGSHRKAVKGGGALTSVPGGSVYALKGGSTWEFLSYDQSSGIWATCCTIPYSSSGKKKKVGKGGSLAASGSRIYAFKGNNCSEFWSFDPATNSWSERPPVPGDKKVKGGAGLVNVPSRNALYAFKGNNTSEFLSYDIAGATWSTRQSIGNAPPPGKARTVKDGGSLTLAVENADSLIYAFKGGSTREFWRYSIAGDSWHYVDSVPYGPTKKTKVKDGAALAWNGANRIYAIKGGKTAEFWAYELALPADSWSPLDGIGGAKLLASGAALGFGNGFCYALKGGGTKEFWRFYEPISTGVAESPATAVPPRLALTVAPNPLRGSAWVSYALVHDGDVSLRLFDIAGRRVSTLVTGRHRAGSYRQSLSPGLVPGVYVLKLETRDGGLTKKLVID